MPIKIPNELPAAKVLTDENIFIMTETRAITQDIRALKILLLNLMPTKIDTETQLSRLLGNTALQIELELIHTRSHESKNTPEDHLLAFYKTFDEVKEQNWDGLIITGAPIEQMEFEEVEYWDELVEIMEWSKTHVHSTFHICWGAQAGLYYHYGIKKHMMQDKMFGVFPHKLDKKTSILFRGSDDIFYVPHSRHTTVYREDIEKEPRLKIIASSDEAGYTPSIMTAAVRFLLWDIRNMIPIPWKRNTCGIKTQDFPIEVPKNYYPNDDDTQEPLVTWRAHANLLYSNWLNYFVYQTSPYDITQINQDQ